MDTTNFVLFIALLFCIFWIVYSNISNGVLRKNLARFQHENVCNIISIDSRPPRLDYSNIPKYWYIYKKEEPKGHHVFVDSVSKAIAEQIKQCNTFEKVLAQFNSFDIVVNNSKLYSAQDQKLIIEVHKKVSDMTFSHVQKLAQVKCHNIWLIPSNVAEKQLKFERFKAELSLLALKNYYSFSYDFFIKEEKERLIKGRVAKKQIKNLALLPS